MGTKAKTVRSKANEDKVGAGSWMDMGRKLHVEGSGVVSVTESEVPQIEGRYSDSSWPSLPGSLLSYLWYCFVNR